MSKTFNDDVRRIADVLKPKMELGENGIVTVDKDAFESTLDGTELSMKDFKAVQEHRDLYVAAQGLALGEIGMDAMKKDSKLSQVSAESKMHKDKIGSVFTRSKNFPDGKGGQQTTHGVLSSRVKVNGAGNRGQHKLVREHLKEQASKLFG